MEHGFDLGDFELESGEVLPRARIVYETHGKLSPSGDNAIVYATWYTGRHTDVAPAIGEGRALDSSKYFVVVPNTFGNGLSSSPSNTDLPEFPLVSTADNVRAQYRLLTERLGVRRVVLVVGYSMSAQQAFHWGAMYPDFVERIAPICGSPKTTPHNWLFLEGLKAALQADPAWRDRGERGIRAFATVYAGWFASQAFYRQGLHLQMPQGKLPSTSVYLDLVASLFASFDPRDLMALLATWQSTDLGRHAKFGGDLDKALGTIRARALVMPSETDLYFPPEDSAAAVERMPNARLRIIPSVWGHLAGNPTLNPADTAFVEAGLRELLAEPA
jgi:homoserine O-acetyltransferase/O-succinyltransferase